MKTDHQPRDWDTHTNLLTKQLRLLPGHRWSLPTPACSCPESSLQPKTAGANESVGSEEGVGAGYEELTSGGPAVFPRLRGTEHQLHVTVGMMRYHVGEQGDLDQKWQSVFMVSEWPRQYKWLHGIYHDYFITSFWFTNPLSLGSSRSADISSTTGAGTRATYHVDFILGVTQVQLPLQLPLSIRGAVFLARQIDHLPILLHLSRGGGRTEKWNRRSERLRQIESLSTGWIDTNTSTCVCLRMIWSNAACALYLGQKLNKCNSNKRINNINYYPRGPQYEQTVKGLRSLHLPLHRTKKRGKIREPTKFVVMWISRCNQTSLSARKGDE